MSDSSDAERLKKLQRFHFGGKSALAAAEPVHGCEPAWLPKRTDEGPSDRELIDPELEVSPLRVLLEQGSAAYKRAWGDWCDRARPLIASLEAVLRHGSESGDLGSSLGGLGVRFVDPEALADRLRSQTVEDLDQAQRERLSNRLEHLERGLAGAWTRRQVVVAEPTLERRIGDLPEGVELILEQDPCEAAARRFDESAPGVAELLASERIARLELERQYDPAQHDLALERFDWRALRSNERALLPSVVCLVSQRTAADGGLGSLSRLLSSGRPLQVLVPIDGLEDLTHTVDLGHLGLSHRRCFVHQGSSGAPTALRRGFDRALSSPGVALHLINGLPDERGQLDSERAWWLLASRRHPVFVFDPYASRVDAALDLSDNPALDDDWMEQDHDASGSKHEALTPAHLALLSDTTATELLPVGESLRSDSLLPLTHWLALDEEGARHKLPTIQARDGSGSLLSMVVSRRLALACAERLENWRILKRMSGHRVDVEGQVPVIAGSALHGGANEGSEERDARERLQMAQQVVHRLMTQLLARDAVVSAPQTDEVQAEFRR